MVKSKQNYFTQGRLWTRLHYAGFVAAKEIVIEYIKESLITISEYLFTKVKNKSEIGQKIRDMSLSAQPVKDRSIKPLKGRRHHQTANQRHQITCGWLGCLWWVERQRWWTNSAAVSIGTERKDREVTECVIQTVNKTMSERLESDSFVTDHIQLSCCMLLSLIILHSPVDLWIGSLYTYIYIHIYSPACAAVQQQKSH